MAGSSFCPVLPDFGEDSLEHWSELAAVWSHVPCWKKAENRRKQGHGMCTRPPHSLPWNLPFCVQMSAPREQQHRWQAWVHSTVSPTSTECHCSLCSYQCLGGAENPRPQSHPCPGLLPARCPPGVRGVGGDPKQCSRRRQQGALWESRAPARPLNWAVSPPEPPALYLEKCGLWGTKQTGALRWELGPDVRATVTPSVSSCSRRQHFPALRFRAAFVFHPGHPQPRTLGPSHSRRKCCWERLLYSDLGPWCGFAERATVSMDTWSLKKQPWTVSDAGHLLSLPWKHLSSSGGSLCLLCEPLWAGLSRHCSVQAFPHHPSVTSGRHMA